MMKSMDVITSVDYGYRVLWTERHYLLKLTAVPIAVKLVFLTILLMLGWDADFIKTSLVMLPSSFADGWMLAHMARLVFLGQRWPFQPTGNPAQDHILLEDRAYGIISGTLFYVLIKHVYYGMMTLFAMFQSAAIPAKVPGEAVTAVAPQVGAGPALAAIILLLLTLWAFRFMFLYIPVAAGLGTRILTRAKHSLRLSLQIWGIWLISVIPCLIFVMFVITMIVPAPDAAKEITLGMGQKSLLLIVQAFADTLMTLISTAAIAHGLRTLIQHEATKE